MLKLHDLGYLDAVKSMMDELLDEFTFDELETAIKRFRKENDMTPTHDRAFDTLFWLTRSNYEIEFDDDIDLTQMVIFPRSQTEVRAIEDARFVYFTDEKGTIAIMLPIQLMMVLIYYLNWWKQKISIGLGCPHFWGTGSQNKGMALFPEK